MFARYQNILKNNCVGNDGTNLHINYAISSNVGFCNPYQSKHGYRPLVMLCSPQVTKILSYYDIVKPKFFNDGGTNLPNKVCRTFVGTVNKTIH